MKNFNNFKRSVDNYKILQSVENISKTNNNTNITNNNQNTKSLSFQDEGIGYLQKSEAEFDNEFFVNVNRNEEFTNYIQGLKTYRNKFIKQYIEDEHIQSLLHNIFTERRGVGSNSKNDELSDLKECIDKLDKILSKNVKSETDESELLLILIKLIILFNSNNRASNIDHFLTSYKLVNFIQIIQSNFVNAKILYLFLFLCNQITSEFPNLIEDLIYYQLIFYLTRLLHTFNQDEIKAELIYLLYQILMVSPDTLKIFLSSGGFFLLPILLESSITKQNEILLLVLIVFLIILEISEKKVEEVLLMFINNKVLTRLNIILLEIFSEESNLENENIGLCLERVLDLLIKFTEIRKLELLCTDNIVRTLINLCYNIPISYIPKVLIIFDAILKDPSMINVILVLILEIGKFGLFRMPS